MLRHTLATLAYRAAKAVRDMPAEAAVYKSGDGGPAPVDILRHMGDLMDWALTSVNGATVWKGAEPREWPAEVERFFASLEKLDDRLASGEPLHCVEAKLFQGPIADALTHTGQIAMLRRMAGAKMKGENYFIADVKEGSVGTEQATPKREF